jgi:hypothetical protein
VQEPAVADRPQAPPVGPDVIDLAGTQPVAEVAP